MVWLPEIVAEAVGEIAGAVVDRKVNPWAEERKQHQNIKEYKEKI